MSVVSVSPGMEARFATKYRVDEELGCWLWTGMIHGGSPLMKGDGGRAALTVNAAVVSYVMHHRPLAEGERILRQCGNFDCVNPGHLEAITSASHAPERFLAKVDKRPGGCWIWTASKRRLGYGQFWDGERLTMAHQWSYLHHVGPVPAGVELDHLCRVPSCVNPAHLEPVTHQVNIARAAARKTHCPNGHPYAG